MQKPELAPKPKVRTTLHGIPIYENPNLTPGTVEIWDRRGRLIGHLYGVGRIDTSDREMIEMI